MDIKQSFLNAVRNLFANKWRFAHVLLSLVAAVAAVIVICNTGRLMVQQVESGWNPELFNNIDVQIGSRADLNRQATIEDLERIAAANPELILGVSPYVNDHTMTGNVRYGDKNYREAYFIGVNEQYADIDAIEMQEGRFIQYLDCRREQNVCVVGTDIAENLLGGEALGKVLNVWGYNYTVIGVMDDGTPGLFYIPYTCAQKIVPEKLWSGYQNNKYYYNRFTVRASAADKVKEVAALITAEMNELFGEGRYTWSLNLMSYLGLKEQIRGYVISTAFNYMLIVFLVLFVGGLGIMNVMLAAVQARTQEIGLRKAFGATNRDIRRQFRLEAVLTSLLGGLLGVALGVILSFSLPWLISDFAIGKTGMSYSTSYLDISLALWPILLALGLSVSVGVIFGTYPAQQAAKLEPVVAINEG